MCLLQKQVRVVKEQVRVITEQVRAVYSNRYRDRQSDINYICAIVLFHLQNCSSILLHTFNSDSMDIASFVFATTPSNDVTMVNKFPSKLVHSFNKLSLRLPFSTQPNWFCISQVLDMTGIIRKKSWEKPGYSAF